MVRKFLNPLASAASALFTKYSWVFGVAGVALAAIGGVITNATVGVYLKNACGEEGNACFHGVTSFLYKTPEGVMVILGGVFTCISVFASYTDKAKIEDLERSCAEKLDQIEALTRLNAETENILEKRYIDTYQFLSVYLKHIAGELDLKTEDRISLYKVSNDHFFLAGRFSENHSYSKPGRKYYPRQQGIIETAYEKNWSQSDLQSTYGPQANRKRKYADEHLKKHRIPAQIVNNFNMKSKCYRASAVRGAGLGHPIAIVCVESVVKGNLNHISRGSLEARLGPLASLLDALEHHMPSMDTAMKQGL